MREILDDLDAMQRELLAIPPHPPDLEAVVIAMRDYLVALIGIQRALIEALAPLLDKPTDS